MALPPITPRDHLQRLVDLGRKTSRHWWLIAVFAVIGGGLSLAFAVTRPRVYQSWATLFYQERIQSQLVSPGREDAAQRNIGDRYRELLLARNQLDLIIVDPNLDPYPRERDPDVKIDKLRLAVRLEAHGANVFRIAFSDSDPERAKRVVDRLTKMLQDKDEALRNEQAAATVAFVTDQQENARAELKKRETAYNEFLSKHPEFVQDSGGTTAEGKGIIHEIRNKTTAATGNPRLLALERQRQRLQASLDAPPGVPPPPVPTPRTPERIAAETAVQDAQRELAAAKKELEDMLSRFTEKHPSVVKAQDRVDNATQKLRRAEAAVPPDIEPPVRVATPEDRVRLQKDLQAIEAQIAAEQSKTGKPNDSAEATKNWVVKLEGENSELRRAVAEQRERVQTLADSAFRAQMDANQKFAEQGGRLAIVDPAFKPAQPTGTGKTVFLAAGMILFLTLGLSLAVGLAVIDDRLYRRADLDQLGVAVLAVIPPTARVRKKPRRRGKKPTQGGAS